MHVSCRSFDEISPQRLAWYFLHSEGYEIFECD